MIKFFEYNWQVRDEWLEWCEHLPVEELLKERIGGVGTILKTLFHIVDVEYSWIRGIQGKQDLVMDFANYNSLQKVRALSDSCKNELTNFMKSELEEMRDAHINVCWDSETYSKDEIIHHIIAHEIHHIGQLSIWAREMNRKPVDAHFIGRKMKRIR